MIAVLKVVVELGLLGALAVCAVLFVMFLAAGCAEVSRRNALKIRRS